MEQWKPINGYEDLYEVSSYGRIRSLSTIVSSSSRNGGFRRRPGIVLRQKKTSNGYLSVMLSKDGITKEFWVHRLVAFAFCPGSGEQVNHKNLNKEDNRSENLEWCSAKENIKHLRENKSYTSSLTKNIICVETGEVFCGSYKAAEWINSRRGYLGSVPAMARTIRSCASGRNKSAYGFHWKDCE